MGNLSSQSTSEIITHKNIKLVTMTGRGRDGFLGAWPNGKAYR